MKKKKTNNPEIITLRKQRSRNSKELKEETKEKRKRRSIEWRQDTEHTLELQHGGKP